MERRLAAILAADVVGYSCLMGDDEEAISCVRKRTATFRFHNAMISYSKKRCSDIRSISKGSLKDNVRSKGWLAAGAVALAVLAAPAHVYAASLDINKYPMSCENKIEFGARDEDSADRVEKLKERVGAYIKWRDQLGEEEFGYTPEKQRAENRLIGSKYKCDEKLHGDGSGWLRGTQYFDLLDLGLIDLLRNQQGAIDLRGACLRKADFRGAKMPGADLRGANFYKTDLTGSEIQGAHISNAVLACAHLGNSDLNGADLSGSDLTRVQLKGTYAGKVNLTGAKYEPLSHPLERSLTLMEGYETLWYDQTAKGLAELREKLHKFGERELARKVNFALRRARNDKLEPMAQFYDWFFFDATIRYGLAPERMLYGIFLLILIGVAVYAPVIRWPGLGGSAIYKVYLNSGSGESAQEESAMRQDIELHEGIVKSFLLAFVFSLSSSLQLGLRGIRMENLFFSFNPHDYYLVPRGWAKPVSTFQSLASLIFIAIWVIAYLSRVVEDLGAY